MSEGPLDIRIQLPAAEDALAPELVETIIAMEGLRESFEAAQQNPQHYLSHMMRTICADVGLPAEMMEEIEIRDIHGAVAARGYFPAQRMTLSNFPPDSGIVNGEYEVTGRAVVRRLEDERREWASEYQCEMTSEANEAERGARYWRDRARDIRMGSEQPTINDMLRPELRGEPDYWRHPTSRTSHFGHFRFNRFVTLVIAARRHPWDESRDIIESCSPRFVEFVDTRYREYRRSCPSIPLDDMVFMLIHDHDIDALGERQWVAANILRGEGTTHYTAMSPNQQQRHLEREQRRLISRGRSLIANFNERAISALSGDPHAHVANRPPVNDGPITQAKIDRVFGTSGRYDEDELRRITAKAQRHLRPDQRVDLSSP